MSFRGDTHNFGRYVKPYSKNWILKPRSTFWEELFLSENSAFRQELKRVLGDEPIMACLPNLAYKRLNEKETLVERIHVTPATTKSCDLEYALEALGGLLALGIWFGLSDLHFENIFFGHDKKTGKLILTPVDIEMIFNNMYLLGKVGILQEDPRRGGIHGASSVLSFIHEAGARESLAVAFGYTQVSTKLLANAPNIVKVLKSIKGIKDEPIRTLLRNTHDYDLYMGKGPIELLLDKQIKVDPVEEEQMKRGDVPYFIRSLRDQKIRYYLDKNLKYTKHLKLQKWLHVTKLLQPDELFKRCRRRDILLEHNRIILADHFLPRDFTGKLHYRGLDVNVSKRAIHVKYKNELLKGARHWSDFLVPIR